MTRSKKEKSRMLITIGDPAGIGTEIILKALKSSKIPNNVEPILIGCKEKIKLNYENLLSKVDGDKIANPLSFEIINIPFDGEIRLGKPNKKTGDASFQYLTRATNLILKKEAIALVTAPISKHLWHEAGHFYSGRTELLGELDSVSKPSMLFTAVSPISGWRFNTLLATTHIPYKNVPEKLNPELIISKLNTLLKFCRQFKINPKLVIAGLNPHAGEDGNLGEEEITWIMPTVQKWRDNNPGITLEGPLPPDSCWLSSAQSWHDKSNADGPDGILALYHDQGLIAVKLIAFDSAVNTTLGLSFIRTSPDHGTAFNIAGKGIAKEESMIAAIKTAYELSGFQ